MTSKGKFIVIYGPNNIGKSTQTKLLVKRLKEKKYKVKLLKYPIYNLKPTGPLLYRFLRNKNDLSEEEIQKIFAQNRADYEPKLTKLLKEGWNIVAEDYKGTGICWGVTNGVTLKRMENINKELLDEDIAILLTGKRFKWAKEKGHRNEDGGRWKLSRDVHNKLGLRYGWIKVNANLKIEEVAHEIWRIVEKVLD